MYDIICWCVLLILRNDDFHLNGFNGGISVVHDTCNPIKGKPGGGTNDSSWCKLSSIGSICVASINWTLWKNFNLSFKINITIFYNYLFSLFSVNFSVLFCTNLTLKYWWIVEKSVNSRVMLWVNSETMLWKGQDFDWFTDSALHPVDKLLLVIKINISALCDAWNWCHGIVGRVIGV